MRFAFLNHWYPEAWDAWKRQGGEQLHGTADYWDVALRAAGHESETLILNDMLAINIFSLARARRPDVVVSMEVGRFSARTIRQYMPDVKAVAFCSHAASDSDLQGFDCIFSSFKWMPDYCKSIGVRCEYLPLAFGRPVLERLGELPKERDIPVCFIGGLGNRTWDQGTRTMVAIASAVPGFEWRGYWQGDESQIPPAIQRCRKPTVYGADMYRLLARTKICLNRHGEIARGWANNCRTFEGPGVGCYLLSDCDGAFACNTYSSADEAIEKINSILESWDEGGMIYAETSQQAILREHCFENRVPRFLEVVESL